MMVDNLGIRIQAVCPDADCDVIGDDYAAITWRDSRPVPTIEELVAVDVAAFENMLFIRAERNRRLAACDYTQLADANLTTAQRDAWAAYRSALRNLPQSQPAVTIDTVVWPVQPNNI